MGLWSFYVGGLVGVVHEELVYQEIDECVALEFAVGFFGRFEVRGSLSCGG